jgi:hypothetical protein
MALTSFSVEPNLVYSVPALGGEEPIDEQRCTILAQFNGIAIASVAKLIVAVDGDFRCLNVSKLMSL